MKIRITVDRETGMSYVYLPVQDAGRPLVNTTLPGPFAINIDKTPSGEIAGIEIGIPITSVDLEDITEGAA